MFADSQFQELFVPVALGVVVVLLVVMGVLARRRAKAAAVAASRLGAGSALACVLDGDLDGARRILEGVVRSAAGRTPDAIVGLVSVLRVQSEWGLALELMERLALDHSVPWLTALRVRLALDMGESGRAIELVEGDPSVPTLLAVAAYARAGRWQDAHACYRKRTARKGRDKEAEANLIAGVAMELHRGGDERGAKRALKRAQGLSQSSLLVLMADHALGGTDPDEDAAVRARLPWLFPADGGLIAPDEAAQGTLDTARHAYEAGNVEQALGQLRDALDERPALHVLRAQYADWILDVGAPSDWRTELSEALEMLHRLEPNRVRPCCTACDFRGRFAFAVCPRCNAVGTVVAGTMDPLAGDGVSHMSALVAVARFWGLSESSSGVDSAKP